MEVCLFVSQGCHVFRLPQTNYLQSETWEGNHIWTGTVKVLQREGIHDRATSSSENRKRNAPHHAIVLLDTQTSAVFGECPLRDHDEDGATSTGPICFQQSSDSSRCFIVRVESNTDSPQSGSSNSKTLRHAYLGIHFESKSEAFQFQCVVLERHRGVRSVQQLPVEDRSLAMCGEKIRVDLIGKVKPPTTSSSTGTLAGVVVGIPLSSIPTATGAARRRIVMTNAAPQERDDPPPRTIIGGRDTGEVPTTVMRTTARMETVLGNGKPSEGMTQLFGDLVVAKENTHMVEGVVRKTLDEFFS